MGDLKRLGFKLSLQLWLVDMDIQIWIYCVVIRDMEDLRMKGL